MAAFGRATEIRAGVPGKTVPYSLAVVDALGFFRLLAVKLGLPGHSVAATADQVYVTHPDHDSVSVVSTSTSTGHGKSASAACNASA